MNNPRWVTKLYEGTFLGSMEHLNDEPEDQRLAVLSMGDLIKSHPIWTLKLDEPEALVKKLFRDAFGIIDPAHVAIGGEWDVSASVRGARLWIGRTADANAQIKKLQQERDQRKRQRNTGGEG
jgi:hypothetical protein